MIREQGLEPIPLRRWLLGCGLSNAWEVYQCLVLAEVESYRSIRDSFALAPLDTLIDRNTPALDALKTLRDKLLHPTKDVPYDSTRVQYFREVERRYPMSAVFVKHLQALLDQHLRILKDHLVEVLADDIAHLPDNRLHVFSLAENPTSPVPWSGADNTIETRGIEELLRHHGEFARGMRIDPARQDDPLDKGQRKQIRLLNDLYSMLAITPLPTTDYHVPETVAADP